MKSTIRKIWAFGAVAIVIIGLATPVMADNFSAEVTNSAIGVMPLANFTDQSEAMEKFAPAIEENLVQQGFQVITSGDLRATLRKYRIRALGAVDVADIMNIAEETGLRYLLFGSVDIYQDGPNPLAGFSARIMDVKSMRIVWAASTAAGGNDFTGLFGIGRIDSMDKLIIKLTDKSFKDLLKQLNGASVRPASEDLVALVNFDNFTKADYGGEIISNYILAELVARGIDVIEPVILNNIFLDNAGAPRGQIDLNLLKILASNYGVDYVITGSLYRFHTVQNESDNAVSEIELSGRLLETAQGRILDVFNRERDGSRSPSLIGSGSNGSLGKLTGEIVREMLNSFDKATSKRMADK